MSASTTGSPTPGGWRRILFGLLVVAALVLAALRFSDIERFAEMARHARPLWMVAALALQSATYVFAALAWRAVLASAGAPQPLGRLVPLALAKLFVDQVVPGAGIGGNILLVDRLTARGAPRGAAVAAMLISMLGYYIAYALLALLMLFLLWVHRQATPLLVGLVTSFLLVALAIPALALWLRKRGSKPLPDWAERFKPVRSLLEIVGEAPPELLRNRRLLARVTLWNALVFLADAATLCACLAAIGQPWLAGTAFIAFITASIAATLGPVPMGLGSFEAGSVAMLTMLGVPLAPAVTATLLLRSLTLWLPLPPGLFLLRADLRREYPRRKIAS